MNLDRLEEILEEAVNAKIGVVGDFFLDLYWSIDPNLVETSIETGRPAHQIVERRSAPGAAGTVVNNLVALGAGSIQVVGLIGEDPSGAELKELLDQPGMDTSGLLRAAGRFTPVYTKPMFRGTSSEIEGDRFDLKNRTPVPQLFEDRLIVQCEARFDAVDAAVVLDQVQEEGCGTVTDRVREAILRLARLHPDKPLLADSRSRIGRFRDVMIKPNLAEASAATGIAASDRTKMSDKLHERVGRPVFLTLGADGLLLHDADGAKLFAALQVAGPIDPVGAGDSMSAGIVLALALGATAQEAAQVGLLAAAVTIQKIGTTGTATVAEILEIAARHREHVSKW